MRGWNSGTLLKLVVVLVGVCSVLVVADRWSIVAWSQGPPIPASSIWGSGQQVSPTWSGVDRNPSLAVAGTDVYIAWTGDTTGPQHDPWLNMSTDDGATWSPSAATNISPSVNTTSGGLDMVTDGSGTRHFVWREGAESAPDPHYNCNTCVTEIITTTGGGSWTPVAAIADDTIHVVWQESGAEEYIYHTSRPLSGGSWAAVTTLASQQNLLQHPDITTDYNGNVHVVWANWLGSGVTSTIKYKKRTPAGAWLATMDLMSPSLVITTKHTNSSITTKGDNVYVAWTEIIDTAGAPDQYIYFVRSTDGGSNWGVPERVFGPLQSEKPAYAVPPRLATDDRGYVWMAWHSEPPGLSADEVFCSFSKDQGLTWWQSPLPDPNTDINVSKSNTANSQTPSLVIQGSKVYVAWREGEEIWFTAGNLGTEYVYLPLVLKSY